MNGRTSAGRVMACFRFCWVVKMWRRDLEGGVRGMVSLRTRHGKVCYGEPSGNRPQLTQTWPGDCLRGCDNAATLRSGAAADPFRLAGQNRPENRYRRRDRWLRDPTAAAPVAETDYQPRSAWARSARSLLCFDVSLPMT
jgi:hypothetical protein